jgi:hypothetical protein
MAGREPEATAARPERRRVRRSSRWIDPAPPRPTASPASIKSTAADNARSSGSARRRRRSIKTSSRSARPPTQRVSAQRDSPRLTTARRSNSTPHPASPVCRASAPPSHRSAANRARRGRPALAVRTSTSSSRPARGCVPATPIATTRPSPCVSSGRRGTHRECSAPRAASLATRSDGREPRSPGRLGLPVRGADWGELRQHDPTHGWRCGCRRSEQRVGRASCRRRGIWRTGRRDGCRGRGRARRGSQWTSRRCRRSGGRRRLPRAAGNVLRHAAMLSSVHLRRYLHDDALTALDASGGASFTRRPSCSCRAISRPYEPAPVTMPDAAAVTTFSACEK